MKYVTIICLMLVSLMVGDLAPDPDVKNTGVAQNWYTDYLARMEAERVAKIAGKPKKATSC